MHLEGSTHMKCPTCRMNLDDALDFDDENLCCPNCGREFSAREIAALPVEEYSISYRAPTYLPLYRLEWDMAQVPQWV